MKKFFLLLALVAVLIVASIFWVIRSAGTMDPAALVPSETVVFASLPDLPRSAVRWYQTSLYKIGGETEVHAFLEKPLAKLNETGAGNEAASILLGLKPGRIFTALTSVNGRNLHFLVGFQFWGGKKDLDNAMNRLRDQIGRKADSESIPVENYQGDEIVATPHAPGILYTASHGRWGFLSNNPEAIKDALDRAAGRQKTPSLSSNPAYSNAKGRMLKDPDFFVFSQPKPLFDSLLEVGQSMGYTAIPEQVDKIKGIQVFAAAMKFDGADISDAIYVQRPGQPDFGSLQNKALKFTTPYTLAYFSTLLDPSNLTEAATNPAVLKAVPMLAESPELIQKVVSSFGPECSIVAQWPVEAARPNVLLALQVRDVAGATDCLKTITSYVPETTVAERNGHTFYNFPSLSSPLADPTFTIADDFLLVGLDGASVEKAATETATDTIEKSPAFASIQPVFKSSNEVFGYVNTAALFDRFYAAVKPIVLFGVALVPNASQYIDTNKLPSALAISKHLGPITYTQKHLPDGFLIESRGPITLNQAALIGLVGAGAAGFNKAAR